MSRRSPRPPAEAAAPVAPATTVVPRGRVTIDDVARVAGVSKATVSRVLNRRDTLLSPEIAARVQVAIAQLNYVPSPMAQALKRGRSGLIGLVVADVGNPFSVAVLRGAEKACRDAGYMVMLFNLGNDHTHESAAVRALASYQVEGFILHTAGHDTAALQDAQQRGKPVVLIDRRLGDAQVDLVELDNAGAVRLAAGHLLTAGYSELLYVTEPTQGFSSREQRAAAFRAFVADPPQPCRGRVLETPAGDDDTLDAALLAVKQRAGDGLPAVLTANAVVTLRVAAAAARLGWALGRQLGLIGFDDTDWAPLVGPGLSSIAQPTDDIGRLAARCLIERIEGETGAPRQVLLPGRLVPRGSTRPVA